MPKQYEICKRCIMDTTDPDISFDEEGVCNHCRKYDIRVANEVETGDEGERRLQAIAARIRADGANKKYDCIIGLSGGVDSSMAAYTAKRLGLRPLAVHLDNGWNSELAVQNMTRIVDRLDFDFQLHKVDWEEFKDLQLSFLKASVPNCEIPTDHAINALLLHTAAQQNVRYIIGGGNIATEGILPPAWGHYNLDLKHIRAIHRRFGTLPLRTIPLISVSSFVHHVLIRGIRIIPVLNYIDYRKTSAVRLLEQELGWQSPGGKHYESVYTRFVQGHVLPNKFGFDKRKAHFSTLICSGDMSRDDALKEIEKSPYPKSDMWADRALLLEKFGISSEELEQILEAPAKKHEDYPRSRVVFGSMIRLRAVFKKLATRG